MRTYKIIAINLVALMIASCVTAETVDRDFTSKMIAASTIKDPVKRLSAIEILLEDASEYERYVLLPRAAKTAIIVNEFKKAESYSIELLGLSNKYSNGWNYGNAVHDGNMVLGLAALEKNQIEDAKKYLLNAGQAPTSPQIKNFGPNMMLAEALLEIGEKKIVINYLQLLKKSWINNDGKLDSWIAAINGGGKPYFGANLSY